MLIKGPRIRSPGPSGLKGGGINVKRIILNEYGLSEKGGWLGLSRAESRREKRRLMLSCAILMITLVFHKASLCGPVENPNPLLQPGDRLPKIFFPNSLTPEESKYLGIGKRKTFSLDEIKSRLILIEFINTNCMYCIKAVPKFNEIYQTILQDPSLITGVKMVAVGTGDTPTEVENFKSGYRIPYPILPDTEYKAHKAVGEPRVPFLLIARRDNQGRWIIARTQVGLIGTLESESPIYFDEDWRGLDAQGISSLQSFIEELKAILATDPKKLRFKEAK